MFFNNLKQIGIVDKEVILSLKSNEKIKIPFLEIDKIYIQVKKIELIYIFLFIALSVSFIWFTIWFLGFELILLSPVLLIVLGVMKLSKNKRYELRVFLKSGSNLIQPIPLRLKYQTIDVINKVPKEKVKLQRIKF
jgi:hypothetical protein